SWVQPDAASFQAAAATADWASARDFSLVITNAPGADAWPIAAANFMLMYRQPRDPQRAAETLAFFKWALEKGQPQAQALDYVPLPARLGAQIEAYWAAELQAGVQQ